MSVTKENKILASDVSTIASDAKKALPKAGDGITVSTTDDGTTVSLDNVVTAGNVGPSANATLVYGGTFTVPYIQYDEHGRVISGTTRTMTMPSADSSSVTNISGNAGTATKLQTARTIYVKTTQQNNAINGVGNYYGSYTYKINQVVGSANFDGSGDCTITIPAFLIRTDNNCNCDCNCSTD